MYKLCNKEVDTYAKLITDFWSVLKSNVSESHFQRYEQWKKRVLELFLLRVIPMTWQLMLVA